MQVAKNAVVSIHYKLTNAQGDVIDTSEGQEPLVYLQGFANIIPGLENALDGKAVGDAFEVTVQPEDGYGDINPNLIETVPLAAFQGVEKVEAGMQFQAEGPDGSVQMITVKEVDGDNVIVDANSPLAGQVLHFDVSVVDIREATAQEIEHGHVHAHGHDH